MGEGFVYALINASIPGYVKIGKTSRSPDERAKELSAATGVPTPFIVAFEAYFFDCDHAESYVHELLQARNVARVSGREFFVTSVREAVKAITDAEKLLGQVGTGQTGLPSDMPRGHSTSNNQDRPWNDIFEQAGAYHYGFEDTIKDVDRAEELYKKAAVLGALEAFAALAEICADRGEPEQGIRWLLKGAEQGSNNCWLSLGYIWSGKGLLHWDDIAPEPENAKKAFRHYFKGIDFEFIQANGDRVFGWLRDYVRLVRQDGPDSPDAKVALKVANLLSRAISSNDPGRALKLNQLKSLVS